MPVSSHSKGTPLGRPILGPVTNQSSRSIQAVQHLVGGLRRKVDALAEACRRHDGLEVPPPYDVSGDASESSFFLRYQRSAVVGFASASAGRSVEVLGMVHPERRREGIGRALLAAVALECRGRGAAHFLLVCEEASPSGCAFAEAVGGAYRFSEHRMKLDRGAFAKRERANEPIHIVRAEPDDLEALVSIRTAAFGGSADEARTQIGRWLREGNQRIDLARSAGEPIGMVRLATYEAETFINGLAVLPAHQRRGHGRAILEHAAKVLLAVNRERILLEVETDNRAALSLYHACGFREISTYRYYRLRP